MGKTLTGPINMSQVIDFTKSITESFYEWETPKIEQVFWDSSSVSKAYYSDNMLPSNNKSFRELYRSTKSKTLAKIADNASEFAVALNVYNKGHFCFKTRIYDQTMLEDAISGQTFPATIKKFLFYTTKGDYAHSGFDRFLEHRNKMIDQAQARIDQSVSGAAYKLMNDLHS